MVLQAVEGSRAAVHQERILLAEGCSVKMAAARMDLDHKRLAPLLVGLKHN